MTGTTGGDRRALAALVGGGVLAGGNAVGVRFTVYELDALWGAGLRFLMAATILAGFLRLLRLRLPRGRALAGAALFGLLNYAGAFGFAYYALTHMQAGLASTLLALVPLATLLLAVSQRQERLRPSAVVGGVLALGGVATISNVSLAGSVPPLALLAGIGGVLCFGQAAVVVRAFPSLHPVVMNTVAMGVGGAVLLAGAVVAGDRLALPRHPTTWLAIAYLVVVGSIVVFGLFLFVLRRWAASRAAYLDVLIPPVAVALSAWLDREPIGAGLVVGGLLILAGVYVGAVRPASAPAATPTSPSQPRVARARPLARRHAAPPGHPPPGPA